MGESLGRVCVCKGENDGASGYLERGLLSPMEKCRGQRM